MVETEFQANEIVKEIKEGKISFEDAAKKSSQCLSEKQGGDLGCFGCGVMLKEFEDSAFSTGIGEISAPIKLSSDGILSKLSIRNNKIYAYVIANLK